MDQVVTKNDLLKRALPMLERLGDFIGNGEIDPSRPGSLGTRCDLIGDIRDTLELDTEVERLSSLIASLDNNGTMTVGQKWQLLLRNLDPEALS